MNKGHLLFSVSELEKSFIKVVLDSNVAHRYLGPSVMCLP